MGNNQSVQIAAEALVASTKEQINRKVDDYIQFIKNTSVEIDLEIEDLANELAVLTTAFKESLEMKAVTPGEYDRLTSDVESYVNAQKHSIRRLFAHLEEAGDIFEDMATSICYDSDEDENDEDDEDEDEEGAEDDDEDSIHDSEVESSEGDAQGLPYVTSEGDEGDDDDDVDGDESESNTGGDGSDGDDSEGSDSSYDSFEEEVGDEDVLHYCRFAANDTAAAYEKEMRDIKLPESLLSQRLNMLNQMMYEAAEGSVAGAVQELVENVRLAALDDIDNIICLGMAQDIFSTNDGSLIREVLREVIATGAIARQALDDLPFSRREEIENAKDDIINCVEAQIRDVQLKVSDKPDVLEHLMDLDIDEYGDDYLDEALADIDDVQQQEEEEEEEEEEEKEQPRVEEIEEPKPVKGKSKAGKKEPAAKKDAAPKPSPKKEVVPEPTQEKEEVKTKGSKRKSAEAVPEPKARATRARK
jgi:hypothetical protein